MPPFRAAQIVGARFAFFVSLAHVKDRLKQGDGVFESGLGNLRQIAQNPGKHLSANELRLNQHPRKSLGFQTPASKLQASVASTV